MQTRNLKTLLKISNVSSFSAAAEELNMTLSTVSMQMTALETELGSKLFDRAFRPPRLTPIGRAVCDHAEQLVTAERGLLDACSGEADLTGHYRVGFVPTASIRLLPGFLIRAQKIAGDAQFEIETGLSEVLETGVLSGRLDAAVLTPSPVQQPELEHRTLRQEPLAYAAAETVSGCTAAELFERLPFFHFLPESGIGKLIALKLDEQGLRSDKPIFLDSVEAIMECVNKGIGFTLLPEPDIRRYGLDSTYVLESPGHRDLALVTRKGGLPSRATDHLESLFER